jgi:hypothetical protein
VIKDDVKILVLKNAGKFAERSILTSFWPSGLTSSHTTHARLQLENLFRSLDGTAHLVFNTLLLYILERNDVALSLQHKLLPMEVSQSHATHYGDSVV